MSIRATKQYRIPNLGRVNLNAYVTNPEEEGSFRMSVVWAREGKPPEILYHPCDESAAETFLDGYFAHLFKTEDFCRGINTSEQGWFSRHFVEEVPKEEQLFRASQS